MGTPNSSNLIKIIKIVSPLIAFGVSFVLLLFCMNVVTGDIATLVYGGVMTPEYLSSQNPLISMEELAQLQTEYDQTKSELGVPDFPFNLIYVMIRYIMLDFGTNWETDQPIFEEYLVLSGVSIRIILSSLFAVFIVLSLLMVGLDKSKKRNTNDSKGIVFVRIIGIISPSFLFLWLFLYSEIIIKGGLSAFVSLGWREDMSILANLILPVSLITTITLVPGLISLASGASNKTVFKISVVTLVISLPLIETLFVWPGLGRQCYRAWILRNYPVLLGGTIWIAIIMLIFLMAIELISFKILDEIPKSRNSIKKILNEFSRFNDFYRILALEIIVIGGLILLLVILSSVHTFAPFHPTEDDYTEGYPSYAPPGGNHFFGTDWAGQDIFSRVLFACLNVSTLCVPFGVLAVFGYLVFSGMNQKFSVLFCQIFSFLFNITFLSFWGIIPLIRHYSEEYSLVLVSAYLIVTLGFSTGFIFGSWKAQNNIVDLARTLRQVFSFSVMFQLMLIEFLSFLRLGVWINEPSFGHDLAMAGLTFLDYPWLLAPLIILIFILIVLAGFALSEITIDHLKKVKEIFQNRNSLEISE